MSNICNDLIFSFETASNEASGLIGSKGSLLVKMASLGLPVPPGFIITTDAFKAYRANNNKLPETLLRSIKTALRELEQRTGKELGNPEQPLMLSARSSGVVSMPGMLRSVLNVGITQEVLEHWHQDLTFLYDTHRRFLVNYVTKVINQVDILNDPHLKNSPKNFDELKAYNARLLDIISQKDLTIPDDPFMQLCAAIEGVFRSWNLPGATDYRLQHLIDNSRGMAVVVQQMVFGNHINFSGSGVVSTRHLTTGSCELGGTYLLNSQGEEVVGSYSLRVSQPIIQLKDEMPIVYISLEAMCRKLETYLEWPQEIEFTVENNKIWLLQTRRAPLNAHASIQAAYDMVQEGILSPERAVYKTPPDAVRVVSQPQFADIAVVEAIKKGRLLAKGLGASSGIVTGHLVLQVDSLCSTENLSQAILVKEVLDPMQSLSDIQKCGGLITIRGGVSSHAATLARKMRLPYVACCNDLTIDGVNHRVCFYDTFVAEGETISIDGQTGNVFIGALEKTQPNPFEALETFKNWVHTIRSNSVWDVACYPDRDGIQTDYLQQAQHILKNAGWKTDKAKAIELMRLIPFEYRIEQIVVNARDRDLLRILMLLGIEKGYWIGPKCCYSSRPRLGKGLWQMAIRTPEQVDDFLNNPDYQGLGSSGGYPRWIEDEHLEEIVVVYDPPYKGLPEFASTQFFFTISCFPDSGFVEIELVPGTSRVRTLEDSLPEKLIHLRMQLDYDSPQYRGRLSFSFGRSYLKSEAVSELSSLLKKIASGTVLTSSNPLSSLANLLHNSLGVHPRSDELHIATVIAQAMQANKIDTSVYDLLIQPSALKIAKDVGTKVFGDWWIAPFELPYRMRALDASYGQEILEFQGGCKLDGEIDYILLWDAKGREEHLSLQYTDNHWRKEL